MSDGDLERLVIVTRHDRRRNAQSRNLEQSDDAVLDGARRATARFMMADVVDEQRWGVFAPEEKDVHVAGKNGWGPLPDGYHLNSTGWVSGEGREYVLGILSTSPRGFRHGRETISSVARLCHDALGEELA